MSDPGKTSHPGPVPDPAAVTAGALMALEPQAARALRDGITLAERPGSTATRRRGQGHEIRELRPFAEGDDPRHIDAAATARSGNPQVRSFHEDREYSLMLIADFRRPMLWGSRGRLRSVAAAEALMLAGWRVALSGGAVGAVALTDTGPSLQPPRPRHRGMAQVAGLLARAHDQALERMHRSHRPLWLHPADTPQDPVPELADALARVARQVPRGAGILLATGLDLPGDTLDVALAALRNRGPLQLLLIEDAFEIAPPGIPLTHATPTGPEMARFTALPDQRKARAERLSLPGQQVRRLRVQGGAT